MDLRVINGVFSVVCLVVNFQYIYGRISHEIVTELVGVLCCIDSFKSVQPVQRG